MYIYIYYIIYIYIMKTMFPPDYHHNGFVATHALGYIYIYIYYAHLASVGFEYFVCGSLKITYIFI